MPSGFGRTRCCTQQNRVRQGRGERVRCRGEGFQCRRHVHEGRLRSRRSGRCRRLGFCLRGDGLWHCGNRWVWLQCQRLSEVGLCTVGAVGAGTSASVIDKTGYGRVGEPAPSEGEFGYGPVGLVGSGVSESITQETAAGIAGLVGAGTSASVAQETGYGTVGLVGSGASAPVPR